jgi:hypothetical protein
MAAAYAHTHGRGSEAAIADTAKDVFNAHGWVNKYPDAKANPEAAPSSCQSDRYFNDRHRLFRRANHDRAHDECNEL